MEFIYNLGFILAMEPGAVIALSICFAVIIFSISFLIFYIHKQNKIVEETQSKITDKELIEIINNTTGKIVTVQQLSRKLQMKKTDLSHRLRYLASKKVLKILRNTMGTKVYYGLSKPIEKDYTTLRLSNEPFMTLDDLIKIFEFYDYNVSLMDICLVTGLPVKIIIREMKYFQKKGIINQIVQSMDPYGASMKSIYILSEDYANSSFTSLDESQTNLELKEVYRKAVKEIRR